MNQSESEIIMRIIYANYHIRNYPVFSRCCFNDDFPVLLQKQTEVTAGINK